MPIDWSEALNMESRCPRIAVVLGSGFGDLLGMVQHARVYVGHGVEGYPVPRAPGHGGCIALGTVAGREVIVVQGRVHLYEGYSPKEATFPLRLAHRLGAESVVLTCSAGGLGLPAGTLLLLTDHMRVGPGPPLGVRGYTAPFNVQWTDRVRSMAEKHGISTAQGTVAWTQGPSYETQAEVRYFRQRGACAVGMSTIPEVLEAKRLGMAVLGLALITNAAAGLGPMPLSHDEVLACGAQMKTVLLRLLPGIIRVAPCATG